MPLATEVSLPRTVHPRFPDRCIVSGEANPDEVMWFHVDSLTWSSTIAAGQEGALSSIAVPVMKKYKQRLSRQKKFQNFLFILYVLVGVTVAMNVETWLGRDLSRWQKILAVIVGVFPVLSVQVLWPPHLAIRASVKNLVYEFRSAEYALEFEKLNVVMELEP